MVGCSAGISGGVARQDRGCPCGHGGVPATVKASCGPACLGSEPLESGEQSPRLFQGSDVVLCPAKGPAQSLVAEKALNCQWDQRDPDTLMVPMGFLKGSQLREDRQRRGLPQQALGHR